MSACVLSQTCSWWMKQKKDKCVWALEVQPCTSVMLNTVRVGPGEHLRGTGLNTWFGTALHFLGPSTHLSLSLGASSLPFPLASWEEGTVMLIGLTDSLRLCVLIKS